MHPRSGQQVKRSLSTPTHEGCYSGQVTRGSPTPRKQAAHYRTPFYEDHSHETPLTFFLIYGGKVVGGGKLDQTVQVLLLATISGSLTQNRDFQELTVYLRIKAQVPLLETM